MEISEFPVLGWFQGRITILWLTNETSTQIEMTDPLAKRIVC